MVDISNIKIGSIVVCSKWTGGRRMIKVEGFDEKNGRRLLDGKVIEGPEKGQGVWAYLDQVIEIRP